MIESPIEPEPESSSDNSNQKEEKEEAEVKERESIMKALSPTQRTSKILAIPRGKSVRVGVEKNYGTVRRSHKKDSLIEEEPN